MSVLCLVGDRPLISVLLSLSVIVILGAGDACLCVESLSGGWNELLNLDRDQNCPSSSINRDGGLDIRPDLVLTSVSSSDGKAVFRAGCCALPNRPVH